MEFGCDVCFRGDAASVWKAWPFRTLAELVDESHFSIQILACRACGQRCAKVFTEFVDWSGGDDAQYWSVIPLTGDEADELSKQGEAAEIKRIEAFSAGRPYLQADFPTGKPARIVWQQGPVWIARGH